MTPKDGAVNYRLHFWKEDGPPAVAAKRNLLRDGASFETGPEGVQPYACYSWYDKMVGPGIPPVFDATTAVHGTTSLRLTASDSHKLGNPHGFAFVGAAFDRVALKRDRKVHGVGLPEGRSTGREGRDLLRRIHLGGRGLGTACR